MATLNDVQFFSPYYKASDLPDLDAAFADGQRRAISTLQNKIARISEMTRADYERLSGIDRSASAPIGESDE